MDSSALEEADRWRWSWSKISEDDDAEAILRPRARSIPVMADENQ